MGFLSRLFGGTPSREDFAQMVTDALRNAGETGAIEFMPATYTLKITSPDGNRHLMKLTNYYGEFTGVPKNERDEFLLSVAAQQRSSMIPMPKTFSEAKLRLMPSLRRRSYWAFSILSSKLNGMEVDIKPFRLIDDEIGLSLVLDYPDVMRLVDQEMVASWGVSEDEAIAAAIANLRARTEPQWQQVAPGVYASGWEDTYDATRLLIPEVVKDLRVKGRPVAAVPHRNLMIVTGESDTAGLVTMAQILGDIEDEPQMISMKPKVLDGDRWIEPYFAPSHPALLGFQVADMAMVAGDYSDQTDMLAAWYEIQEEDLFVGKFNPTQNKETGALSSYATWTEGVVTLLPHVDEVGFCRVVGDEGEVLGFVPWDDVVRVMGSVMEPMDTYPPRWRVTQFPTPEQIREMNVVKPEE
jgi:hypothetical protein